MAYENQLSGPIASSDITLSIIDVSKIAAALPSKVGQWSVDQIEAHVSVRTFNVLKRKIEVLKDLTGYSDGELLRFRNFGGGSLDDLKRFLLRAVGPDVDMNGLQFEQRDFFKAIGIAVPEWLLKLEIPYLDLSARVRNGLKSLGVERLEELREYSPTDLQALGNFGVSSLACLCKAIQGRIVKGPPEKESYADTLLEAVCLAVSVFSHRDSSIIRLRFGISE
jgi:DNA-directed RNA polymerase alpha subunit